MAQMKLRLSFDAAGPREVWVGPSAEPPAVTTKTEAKELEFAAGEFKPGDQVWVWDRQTGNLASRDITKIQSIWAVAPADFSRVGVVKVHVEHKGLPVAAGEVAVAGGKTQLLDPSSKGALSFYGVKPGPFKVTVRYKSGGKDADPMTVGYDVPLKRQKADPEFTVSIVDDVATVAEAPAADAPKTGTTSAAAADTKGAEEPKGVAGSPFGKLVAILLAAGVIGAGGWFALKYMRDNSDQVSDKLRQLGVDVPKPVDPADAAAASTPGAPMPIAPVPVQKIVLDDSAPDVIGASASSIPMGAPLSMGGEPRLVMDNGDAFELPQGETVVGREVGLGLSLVNETTISRRHASVTRNGSDVKVTDLGSTNGTYVNGVRIQGESPVQVGDQVQFGSVRFRFEG